MEHANSLIDKFTELYKGISLLDIPERIETINKIKLWLHELSPFKNEPVDCVLWVKNDTVHGNEYNPNSVAPPEMRLLEVSIMEDGYTQPIVTWKENDAQREVIDGFHRHLVGKNFPSVASRIHGYLPVVTANENRTDKGDRIAATIRHNRARGKHKIDAMSEIILDLKRRNWSNEKIARELGMDADEILRLSQITGLAEMFSNDEFSEAWEAVGINEDDKLQIEEENI